MQNQTPNDLKAREFVIGPKVKVTKDNKSGAKVINFPFEFPDGERGVAIVCRLDDEDWVPAQDITSLIINFK